jgi:opacity protein-like surface antigen
MKTIIFLAAVSAIMLAACSKKADVVQPTSVQNSTHQQRASMNGRAGVEQIYYDSALFNMNSKELKDQSASSLIAHNKGINILYESDGFITVTDAIQGDGYNPIWRVVDITFNSGFTPHQFYTDTDIEAAASGTNPEITLTTTDEVYRCDIIGPK